MLFTEEYNKSMKSFTQHQKRIRKELLAAGMTNYGLMKGEAKHLPDMIHPDEHIGGVIYGRHGSESAMFVATNLRMIYLEHRPFFRVNDEIAYSVLSGVSFNMQARFAGVTIHTRLGDYTILFVNRNCAKTFVAYIEKRRLEEAGAKTIGDPVLLSPPVATAVIDRATGVFLASHNLATLSTIDREGNIAGAAVYYVLSGDGAIYVATKNDTRKAQNILVHPGVALTVVDEAARQTAQIQGLAAAEADLPKARKVLENILRPRLYRGQADKPPISKISAGDYVILKIMPSSVLFHDYQK